MRIELLHGDCRAILPTLEAGSVQCVVTSPPYWSLRDYGLEPTVWDDPGGCEHVWDCAGKVGGGAHRHGQGSQQNGRGYMAQHEIISQTSTGQYCHHCAAWRGCLGLEPTPALYVQHLVQIFEEIRRVLRPDGVCWLNIGDSYHANGRTGHGARQGYKQGTNRASANKVDVCRPSAPNLKEKDLCLIPFRLAIALQDAGWYVRSVVTLCKQNPMPESVRDRPTSATDLMLMLTKQAQYYYDAEAVREKGIGRVTSGMAGDRKPNHNLNGNYGTSIPWENAKGGRNLRNWWPVVSEGYRDAHFATFGTKWITPCIKATSRPGDTVLDPFCGSGTTGLVAHRLGRSFLGIDAKMAYVEMARERIYNDAPLFLQELQC